ncbi:MAG: AI-2E family transporter [Caulobacteraceae bacterium]|nr:AI-2E family transporter [Caulobacter sp.]
MPPAPVDDADRPRAFRGLRTGVAVCAVVLCAFSLWALREILTPLALAIFLLLMIDGMTRWIEARGPSLPRWASLTTAVVSIVAVFALAIALMVVNGQQFAAQSHAYHDRLDVLLKQGAQAVGIQTPPTLDDLFDEVNPANYVGRIAGGLRKGGEVAVFTLIYLGFLLASRQGFTAKRHELFADDGAAREFERVFDRIRVGVESYIWVQTVVGLMIAAVSAAMMAAVGLSHILFWSFIIFLANYIPAIGAALGVLLPPIFGLVELDGLWRPVLLVVGLEATHFVVSHVVQPRMQGNTLNLDPIVILLALTFWGLLWGVTGAFLSTPLTVVVMAVLAEFRGTRPIAVLLSSDGRPYANDHSAVRPATQRRKESR